MSGQLAEGLYIESPLPAVESTQYGAGSPTYHRWLGSLSWCQVGEPRPCCEKKPEGVSLDTTVERTVFLVDNFWDLSALQSVVGETASSSLRVPGPLGSLSVSWLGL